MTWQDVITGSQPWSIEQGDLLQWLPQLPADSVSLAFFSPPYEAARTYGIDFKLRGQAWVDWMVQVFRECQRVCTGLVTCVCEGQTRDYKYSAVPALLMADLHRAGFNLRKPPVFARVGIPGSGGKDWLRNDWEWIVCTTRGGKLPWSDNTACGHPPRWGPGGAMSNRTSGGARVNEWGGHGKTTFRDKDGKTKRQTGRASQPPASLPVVEPLFTGRRVTSGHKNGDTPNGDSYLPPVLANPGNVLRYKVGGGLMGHALAHENEAPFPLGLAEFFVRSFAAPGSIVLDPFSGSGTTAHAAILHGRRFVGCDVRQSQVQLVERRLAGVTPNMMEVK